MPHKKTLTFSPREIVIIRGISQGSTVKRLALLLGISRRTVYFHLANARERHHLRSNAQLIAEFAKVDHKIDSSLG